MSGFAAHFSIWQKVNNNEGIAMKRIVVKSYGKINLSLDVLGKLDNGYHQVEMVMQQILLCDDVAVRWMPASNSEKRVKIELSTNRPYLPRDQRNLAYKAAQIMVEHYGNQQNGKIRIDIKKRIPVSAGLAGGSGNGAAVLHALNRLWELELDVRTLCRLGSELGSDVPFSVMGQAKANLDLKLYADPMATHCAVARGTGTELAAIKGIKSFLLLTKPPIAVSTREVYQGLESTQINRRPNTGELVRAIEKNNWPSIKKNAVNVLENFTLKRYPKVVYTKDLVEQLLSDCVVMMSGSGPTIFALCTSRQQARDACHALQKYNKETYWTRTTY
jgi:4-diphosphocytidyl-2-C-methyl-D-erythritol kinase